MYRLREDLRHVIEIGGPDGLSAKTAHEGGDERSLIQIVQACPELVNQIAAPHGPAVGRAGLNDPDGLDMTEGLGKLVGRPGANPAQPGHTGLHALFAESDPRMSGRYWHGRP